MKNTEKKSGKGCMTLFAAVFFFAGLVPGGMAVMNIYQVFDARDWVATPSTIVSTELITQRGDDSDTYKAVARYNYQFNGQNYSNDQVGFSKGSDNIGSFHEDAYRELNRYRNQQNAFTAWVNPDNPTEAVLYKTVRWPLVAFKVLFMLIFSGAGAGFYFYGKYNLKRENQVRELQQRHPEAPWKWRPQWQQNQLQSQTGATRWFATFFALFWNLISSPIWFIIPQEFASGNTIVLVAALFPLVGIGMAVWAIQLWRQHYRFGNSVLILKRVPIDLGGQLTANLQLPADVPAGSELNIRLDCIRKTTTRSGNKSNTSESILWQGDQRIIIADAGTYRLVPIRFQLPADQPETSEPTAKSSVFWRMDISSDIPGVDYQASFELPVFDTGFVAELNSAEEPVASLKAETGAAGDPTRSGAIINGGVYHFPAARHKSLIFGLFIFGLVFGGVGLAIIISGQAWFGGVFALVGVLTFWGMLSLLFKRSEIRLENGNIIASSGWFKLKEKLRLPSFQVKKIWVKSNMSSGNTKYYDLFLDDQQGKKHSLASKLIGRRDTEALIAHLETALGIK
ncbi:MAG: DUF3592 domain-containing protein [Xanthomonadales bacterium]|nr:DUF3592 domain-containing protein [Xanthomonadales bacterium]